MLATRHVTEQLERLYMYAAHRPRSVIAAGVGLGIALVVAVTAGQLPSAALAKPVAAGPTAVPVGPSVERDPLAVVAAYNAASIAAAASGDVSLVLQFFAAGSSEPQVIHAEFARRAARGEQHRSSLVRWGVAEQHIQGSSASIVTQEVWDDEIFRNGERVDTRRGTIVRIRYSLSRTSAAEQWRIHTIDSTTVMP